MAEDAAREPGATAALYGALDVIRSVRDGATDQHDRLVATQHDLLLVDGWVLVGGSPVDEIELYIDGLPAQRLVSGYARDDVRDVHGEGAHRSGFRGALPVRGLTPGAHVLVVRVGPQRTDCFRKTPLLVVDLAEPGECAEAVAIEGGVPGGACPIGTMLHVAVRADRIAVGEEPLDAGVVIDGRWFVQGRREDDHFGVLLPTEQLGLGRHTLLACAFAGERRLESAAAVVLVVDGCT